MRDGTPLLIELTLILTGKEFLGGMATVSLSIPTPPVGFSQSILRMSL